jgi:ADP-heptose:LPS heptosyltransferase
MAHQKNRLGVPDDAAERLRAVEVAWSKALQALSPSHLTDEEKEWREIAKLLFGFEKKNDRGLYERCYFISGSNHEIAARILLSKKIKRGFLPFHMRSGLADLFYRDPKWFTEINRRLQFQKIGKGVEAKRTSYQQVVAAILSEPTVSGGIKRAVEMFDIDESTAKKIWTRAKKEKALFFILERVQRRNLVVREDD